jgi:hypothetical protein
LDAHYPALFPSPSQAINLRNPFPFREDRSGREFRFRRTAGSDPGARPQFRHGQLKRRSAAQRFISEHEGRELVSPSKEEAMLPAIVISLTASFLFIAMVSAQDVVTRKRKASAQRGTRQVDKT